jgi:hypothetical protein
MSAPAQGVFASDESEGGEERGKAGVGAWQTVRGKCCSGAGAGVGVGVLGCSVAELAGRRLVT